MAKTDAERIAELELQVRQLKSELKLYQVQEQRKRTRPVSQFIQKVQAVATIDRPETFRTHREDMVTPDFLRASLRDLAVNRKGAQVYRRVVAEKGLTTAINRVRIGPAGRPFYYLTPRERKILGVNVNRLPVEDIARLEIEKKRDLALVKQIGGAYNLIQAYRGQLWGSTRQQSLAGGLLVAAAKRKGGPMRKYVDFIRRDAERLSELRDRNPQGYGELVRKAYAQDLELTKEGSKARKRLEHKLKYVKVAPRSLAKRMAGVRSYAQYGVKMVQFVADVLFKIHENYAHKWADYVEKLADENGTVYLIHQASGKTTYDKDVIDAYDRAKGSDSFID